MVPDPQSSCTRFMEPPISDDVMPHEMASLASIAISLKRIADVLDGTALGLCVTQTIFNPQTVQNRDVRNI